jgi:hypothetical protein
MKFKHKPAAADISGVKRRILGGDWCQSAQA